VHEGGIILHTRWNKEMQRCRLLDSGTSLRTQKSSQIDRPSVRLPLSPDLEVVLSIFCHEQVESPLGPRLLLIDDRTETKHRTRRWNVADETESMIGVQWRRIDGRSDNQHK
jgi:hypothetical protein